MTDQPCREALLPCPFCGGDGDLQDEHGLYFTVSCHTEDCQGSNCECVYHEKAEAIAAWNTRPQSPDPRPTESEVVGALFDYWINDSRDRSDSFVSNERRDATFEKAEKILREKGKIK